MNFFKRLFIKEIEDESAEVRSLENPNTPLSSPASWLIDLFGGTTYSGLNVTPENSLRFSAVWACVAVLSENIASLPFTVYEKQNDNSRKPAFAHPLYTLVHNEPNKYQTSFFFRQTLAMHLMLWGNGYALINRNASALPISFDILHPQMVTPILKDGVLWYKIENIKLPINGRDILHIPGLSFDGVIGLSPISYARQNIGLGLSAEKYGGKFFGSGANLSGVLEHPGSLSPKALGNLRESFDLEYAGIDKSHKTAILEEGMKYTRVGIPPEDAQFIGTRKFQLNEIARIYRVPPHMLGDLDRASFSNIEQQSTDFVTQTLRPWLVRFEQEFNRKVFKESEKGKLFVEFNIEGLLRGDTAARAAYYSSMFQIGVLSQNDIRKFENMNPVENGDKYYVPLNMVATDKVEENKNIEE